MSEIMRLFGNRVALQLVEEEYKGLIVPASTRQKIYVLSKVVALGDKVVLNIQTGDILFWQTNGIIEKQCRYDLDGVPTFVLMAGDMIARLTSRLVTRENFKVIGDWCLVRREVIQPKRIIIPDQVAESSPETMVKFFLEDKGDHPDFLPVSVGEELILDRSRANPIKLGDVPYYYIHRNFVLGTVGN